MLRTLFLTYLELFNHTFCLRDRYRDRDMDEWVVWFYVEPFTLHLNRDRGRHLFPIALILVVVQCPSTGPSSSVDYTIMVCLHCPTETKTDTDTDKFINLHKTQWESVLMSCLLTI